MITRTKSFVAATALLLLTSTASAQQWTPPLGIPTPPFGVFENAPASPSPWITPTTGFYYVDEAHPQSTDSSNPLGTPAKPRETIPISLPAGSVVELHGTYDVNHGSPRTIVANGTSTSPVFIRGTSTSNRPLIRHAWELKGNYVILENLEFGPVSSQSRTGSLVFLAPINHAALRNSDLHGNLDDGGVGVESWNSSLTQNIVIINNTIHDNGDLNSQVDQDVEGVHVGARASNIWVLDNQLYRNSGDGIQIAAGTVADQAGTHHIYVGRNVAYNNRQVGFWSKQAVDVIFSQNVCHSHRISVSSLGQCMGFQYAPQWIWFIANRIYDSDYGIAAQSDNDLGTGTESFFIGNIIYDIHPSEGFIQPSNPWASSGIMLAGGTNHRVINNTMYDVNAGVNVPGADGTLEVRGNIISRVAAGANHLFVENPSRAAVTVFNHNLLEGDPRVRLGGSQQHLTTAQLAAMQSFGVDPMFVNPAGGDFHVQAASKAVDTGDMASIYATFQQRYGISIARDADLTPRPTGAAADIGAYERPGCASAPPDAPSALTSTVTGSSVVLRWTAPTGCNAPSNYWVEAAPTAGGASFGGSFTGGTATSLSFNVPSTGAFFVRVKASNSAGLSPASNDAVVSVGVPNPPMNLTGTVTGTTINLSWQAPSSGITPTSYVVEAGTAPGRADATVSVAASRTSVSSPGVAPGTYYIRIRASAAGKAGAASNEVTLTVR